MIEDIKAYTPMMQQYLTIKAQNQDSLLFYRLGDFYELFFDDAKTASSELDLVLTGKDCGQPERAPMCGIPFHSAEGYIARLVAKGYKVSICEQMEDPALAKGLVKREIIRTVSPGTVTDDSMLDDRSSNYIAAVGLFANAAAVVFMDISTGEAAATGFSGGDTASSLLAEIQRYSPSEIIFNEQAAAYAPLTDGLKTRPGLRRATEDSYFNPLTAEEECLARFGQVECPPEYREALFTTVAGLVNYLKEAKKDELRYIHKLDVYRSAAFMEVGETAFRNLEIAETMIGHTKRGSLLGAMDSTITGMGSRKLRRWIEKPLLNPTVIDKRLNAVAELVGNTVLREELRYMLASMTDLERLCTRVVYGTANCRDLKALSSAISILPGLKNRLSGSVSLLLRDVTKAIDPLPEAYELIEKAIAEDPPFLLRDGGMIRAGYNPEVDRLRYIAGHGKEMIASVEARERERTGIKSLKVSFNKVFGYYIDISNSNKNLVPEDYIRKQTLVNSERYITPELKTIESDILSAEDKGKALEYTLYDEVRKTVAGYAERIQSTAAAVSSLDVLLALAHNACKYRYCRPEVDQSDRLEITEGRHPVVEQLGGDGLFVPNDVSLNCTSSRVMIITGPNMAGKSTYMRQVALIVLMAQVGSFVPAKAAHIGIVDKLFTRVGASDDLSTGRSTFMVEMSEVAEILKNATRKSLIILDEIGRGTSTYDGMAIAKACVEYIVNPKKIGARTLFATHYHELTSMEEEFEGIKNYNIAVKKRGDSISFLRKIVPGGADSSYGVEVALLAGLPPPLITRARTILTELNSLGAPSRVPKKQTLEEEEEPLLTFGNADKEALLEELRGITVETMTPLEALNRLYELSKKAKNL